MSHSQQACLQLGHDRRESSSVYHREAFCWQQTERVKSANGMVWVGGINEI